VWSVKCEVWSVKCEVWSVKCEMWKCEILDENSMFASMAALPVSTHIL